MLARTREVVVVAGASAGVGRATLREFARPGLIARALDDQKAARREGEVQRARRLILQADATDPEQIEGAAAAFAITAKRRTDAII